MPSFSGWAGVLSTNFNVIRGVAMRFIYLDEAGISGPEPVTVIAAIIVEADIQRAEVFRNMANIVRSRVLLEHRPTFIFHAKDIFGGGGVFDRKQFSLDNRLEIIAELAKIPKSLNVPICFSYRHRNFGKGQTSDIPKVEIDDYFIALVQVIAYANSYIRLNCPNEVGVVVSENNNELRRRASRVNSFLANREMAAHAPESLRQHLPVTNLVGPVYFAEKHEEPLLQIADTCAFIVRRFVSGQSNGEKLMSALRDGHEQQIDPRAVMNGVFGIWPPIDINGQATKMPPSGMYES